MNVEIINNIQLDLNYPPIEEDLNNVYIADISGIDSIAALISIIKEDPRAVIIPSIIDVSCEYGNKIEEYKKAVCSLQNTFNAEKKRILPCIVSNIDDFWRELVSKKIQDLITQYEFYSPCIACHLSFHLTRIKLSHQLKVKKVISGEREIHGTKEKINQLDFVLDFFNAVYEGAGIEHLQPIRKIKNNDGIVDIIADVNICPVQLNCLFSGNYYKANTAVLAIEQDKIKNYINSHLKKQLNKLKKNITVNCSLLNN